MDITMFFKVFDQFVLSTPSVARDVTTRCCVGRSLVTMKHAEPIYPLRIFLGTAFALNFVAFAQEVNREFASLGDNDLR